VSVVTGLAPRAFALTLPSGGAYEQAAWTAAESRELAMSTLARKLLARAP
jgi:hypothetical protein